MNRLLPIVEGTGDLYAIPVLLRRLLHEHELYHVQLLRPHRRGELPKIRSGFDNYFRFALKENAVILWVLDFDCDNCSCASQCAQELYSRANAIAPEWPFRVSFMIQEFETLFLADSETTRSTLNIPAGIIFPEDPEQVRDAKGWLTRAMPPGMAYKPTVHQEKLTAKLDLAQLHTSSPSFRHLDQAVLRLLRP